MSKDLLDSTAVDAVAKLAQEAAKAVIVLATGEKAGSYYLLRPNGEPELIVAKPGWHQELLATPQDLAAFIADHKGVYSAVLYSETEAVFVYTLDDRRDRAVCKLVKSPQWDWLEKKSGTSFNQPGFVRLLRIDFRGCLPPDSNLLPMARQMRFSSETDRDIQTSRDSMGKKVMAIAGGNSELPEDVVLLVPVFDNFPGCRVQVPCAVEVFPQDQVLRLTPYPQALRMAMDEALARVRETLTVEEGPPVYQGSPNV
jgi:hypothetical protein